MKKIILMLALVILFTGCEIKDITTADIDILIDNAISQRVSNANEYFNGYKYYLPRGFGIVNKKDNNHILVSNGDYYYLYVDTISYYYKKKNETTFDNELYFSKKINYNDKEGYIKISQPKNDIYFVEISFHYSKIEVYTKKENLEYAIKNSIKILISVKYNDIILETLIGKNYLNYNEEVYNIFESKREDGNFMDYIDEYSDYKEIDKIKDEDILEKNDE